MWDEQTIIHDTIFSGSSITPSSYDDKINVHGVPRRTLRRPGVPRTESSATNALQVYMTSGACRCAASEKNQLCS